MGKIIDRLKHEPAVIIAVIGAAILAAVQQASGAELLNPDFAQTITNLIDNPATPDVPFDGAAFLILVGIVTRFFVSPATSSGG